ncbi:hypothetical protein [Peribacillus frigoritolerans]|uniref:Uncharacterized protein n=1 Tax=Peribacillus castrilensis TaxID=2897690 RepID=A0AAW9N8D1_9BACI|nr:hypothetical protein [Peribacillus castrilensis]
MPKDVIDPELQEWGKSSDFTDLYLKSVQTYKRLFENCQAGSKVEVAMIRLIMIPLMDKALEEPENILMMHHFCIKEEYVYHQAVSIGLIGG